MGGGCSIFQPTGLSLGSGRRSCCVWDPPRVGVGLQGSLPRSCGGAESGAVATPLPSPVRCGPGAQRPDHSAAVRPRAGTPEPDRRVQVCPSLGGRTRWASYETQGAWPWAVRRGEEDTAPPPGSWRCGGRRERDGGESLARIWARRFGTIWGRG